MPVFRVRRLAVSGLFHGQGRGGQLILSGGRQFMLAATDDGAVAVLIDATSEHTAKWYATYGSVALSDAALSLLFPLTQSMLNLKRAGSSEAFLSGFLQFAPVECMEDGFRNEPCLFETLTAIAEILATPLFAGSSEL